MAPKASRLLIELLKLHKPPIDAQILEEYLGHKGGLDIDWTKLLEDEGGWVVVSCDNGKARGAKARLKGPPLHLILPHRKITGFFLSGKMAQRSGFEKVRAVIHTFPEIINRATNAQPGTRFKIYPHRSTYLMSEWPLISPLPPLT